MLPEIFKGARAEGGGDGVGLFFCAAVVDTRFGQQAVEILVALQIGGGATDFVRQYTLASGGPYCDCGYKLKV